MKNEKDGLSKPDLFSYHDYRAYLKDWIAYQRETHGLSLRSLAREIKVSAPYLVYVLEGKRPLSEKTRVVLSRFFQFSRDQKKYFKLLCIISDSNDSQERLLALEEIQTIRKYREQNPTENEIFRYLTKWYYSAVREMAQLPGFRLEAQWIYAQLSQKVSHSDIVGAIQFLTKYGFLKKKTGKTGSQTVELHQKVLDCRPDVYRAALGVFHKQILSLAASSIENVPREQRHIKGQMLPIPSEAFPEVSALLDECLKRISALSDTSKGADSIYHIGFIGLPIARVKSGGE